MFDFCLGAQKVCLIEKKLTMIIFGGLYIFMSTSL